jgi:hypothetical protein
LFDLLAWNSQLLQNVREIDIVDIPQSGEEFPEIFIDLQNLKVLLGKIGGRNGIREIEETQIYDVVLAEKILNFHVVSL